jgi:hypothetical protein
MFIAERQKGFEMEKYGYGNTTVEVATNTPEIHNALKGLEKEIYVLEESLQGLNARLVPVMLPELPADRDMVKGQSISQPHSDIYIQIEALRSKLTGLEILVSNIKQRLEV